MDDFLLQYVYSPIFNDPANKLSKRKSKYSDWNNYQKLAKLNSLEVKINPFKYSRNAYSATPKLTRITDFKRGIYNPALPTLRKMDRDDVLCKLTDDHSRHNTYLTREDFEEESSYLNQPRTTLPTTHKNDDDDYIGFDLYNAYRLLKHRQSLIDLDFKNTDSYRYLHKRSHLDLNNTYDVMDRHNDIKSLYSSYRKKLISAY